MREAERERQSETNRRERERERERERLSGHDEQRPTEQWLMGLCAVIAH